MTLYEGRDTTIRGAYWQHLSPLTLVVVGGLFYIFIIHFYNTEIVGVFSLLSAIAFLFSTVFSLGLQQEVQHFISYHLGRGDGMIRALVRKFTAVGSFCPSVHSLPYRSFHLHSHSSSSILTPIWTTSG